MTPDDRLADAIDRLYVSLAHVPRPVALDGCDHCMSAADRELLCGPTPLRSLPSHLLDRFAYNVAVRTVARPEDLVHYLPRLLADVVLNAVTITDLRRVCATVAPVEGPARGAVGQFLDDLWLAVLRQHPADPRPHEVLVAAQELGHDRGPWLATWLDRLDHRAAAAHLADLLWADGVLSGGRWRPVAGRESDRWDDVSAWLTCSGTYQALLRTAGQTTDPVLRQSLHDAALALEL